jgi:hypothetical protein
MCLPMSTDSTIVRHLTDGLPTIRHLGNTKIIIILMLRTLARSGIMSVLRDTFHGG